ncbi:MAG: DUF4190 domain-containing protein [Acidobacteriota bacterium]
MNCNQCGIDNQMGAQFCRACAQPLLANQQFNQQNFNGQQQFNHQFNQPRQSASGRAITAMILSIVGVFLCGLFASIPGMILGKMEINAIDEGRAPLAGKGFAQTGFYVGMVGTGLSLLCGGFYLLSLFASYGGY